MSLIMINVIPVLCIWDASQQLNFVPKEISGKFKEDYNMKPAIL